MKFGNYDMNPATKDSSRNMFRFYKLKLSAPNFIGRFQSRIETFRRLQSRSESPLSFRASLFENDGSEAGIFARVVYDKFSPNDFPKKHFTDDNFYIFGNTARKIAGHQQNIITGKNYHVIQSNYPTIRKTTDKLPTPPPPPPQQPPRFNSRSCNSTIKRCRIRRQDSKLKDILNASSYLNEDDEFKVLKEYFETNSYSDIVTDPDFKNYLNKKNYGDILDYMNTDSVRGGTATESSDRSSSLDGSQYKQRLCRNSEFGRLSKSKSTGNLYESLTFYNQSDGPMLAANKSPSDNRNVFCHSMKRLKKAVHPPAAFKSPDIPEFKCKRNCHHSERYNEIKKFCQLFFEESHAFDKKVKMSAALGKQFTERGYKKIIARFIKSKGFDSIDEYVYAKFGNILDQTIAYDLTVNDDIPRKMDYSKKYTANIPKRYHVTKQKFLEADFTKNVQNGGSYYTLPTKNHRQPNQHTHTYNTRNPIKSSYSFKSSSTTAGTPSSLNSMRYGDYCFKKRYYNNVKAICNKYGPMMSYNCDDVDEPLPSYHKKHQQPNQQQHHHHSIHRRSHDHGNYNHNWSSSKHYDSSMNYVKKKKIHIPTYYCK